MRGNPLLNKVEKEAQQNPSGSLYNEGVSAYHQASTTQSGNTGTPHVAGRKMTIDDVIVKTGITFVVLLVGAFVGWNLPDGLQWLTWVSLFVAFGLGIWASLRKKPSPALVIGYAIFEGIFLGGISNWYQAYGEAKGTGNLVATAVGITFIVFATLLVAYRSGLIKVTKRARKIFFVMLLSYLGVAIVSLLFAVFGGVGGGWGFYGLGPLGIILSLFAVGLASFSLVIDFDSIARTTQYGVDEKESWRMAFGLMVSLVWLYLELLRLLAILNSNN